MGPCSHRLLLPATWQVHPVFHVSQLRPANLNAELHPPQHDDSARPPPDVIDGTAEYEVEEILDTRRKGRYTEYLVKWVGYPPSESTWEPRGQLMKHAGDIVLAHKRKQKHTVKSATVEVASPFGGGACHSGTHSALSSTPASSPEPVDYFEPRMISDQTGHPEQENPRMQLDIVFNSATDQILAGWEYPQ